MKWRSVKDEPIPDDMESMYLLVDAEGQFGIGNYYRTAGGRRTGRIGWVHSSRSGNPYIWSTNHPPDQATHWMPLNELPPPPREDD